MAEKPNRQSAGKTTRRQSDRKNGARQRTAGKSAQKAAGQTAGETRKKVAGKAAKQAAGKSAKRTAKQATDKAAKQQRQTRDTRQEIEKTRTAPEEKTRTAPRRSLKSQRAHIRQLRLEQHAKARQEEVWRRRAVPMWGKLLIGVAVVMLLLLVFFRVETFEATGNVHYTVQELADASGVTEGDVLMGVNKTQVAGRILTKLPYVTKIEITKTLPGTITFTIEECAAVVAAQTESGTTWLMSEKGKLLEKLSDDTTLPVIYGLTLDLPTLGDQANLGDETLGTLALEIANVIYDLGLSETIHSIDLTDPDDIILDYGSRMEIWLGSASDPSYQLQYMVKALAELSSSARGALDVSFSDSEAAVYHSLKS